MVKLMVPAAAPGRLQSSAPSATAPAVSSDRLGHGGLNWDGAVLEEDQ
jgi:hypothetical protein